MHIGMRQTGLRVRKGAMDGSAATSLVETHYMAPFGFTVTIYAGKGILVAERRERYHRGLTEIGNSHERRGLCTNLGEHTYQTI